ncbi:MAG TPA: hypothetical protein VLE51_00700 [Candidatus Saccharimonadales bacterium]|nr:hypothetical protein [Candidatus Saccharimonadales bacterium]
MSRDLLEVLPPSQPDQSLQAPEVHKTDNSVGTLDVDPQELVSRGLKFSMENGGLNPAIGRELLSRWSSRK